MKKLLTAMIAIAMSGFMMAAPVFAEKCTCPDGSEGVATAILGDGCSCDNGSGSSVLAVLTLVLDILTGLIGIVAVIGITIVGIQYLTAGGSEEKTRKAKQRMFEIIIGLAVYATFFLVMQWLIKDFEIKDGSFNSSTESSQTN